MAVMSLEKWLKLTDGGMMSVRSTSLKKVDAALGRYLQSKQESDKMALRTALQAWMQEKGDWQSSVRNRYFAVSDLHKQLSGKPPALDARELAALEAVNEESTRLLAVLFQGRQVTWREGLGRLGGRKLEAVYDVGQGAVGVAWDSERIHMGDESKTLLAQKWAAKLFDEMIPVEYQALVKYALLSGFPTFMRDLAAAVTPYIGIITTSGDLALNIGRLARAQYRVSQARTHASQGINDAEPEAAIKALVRLLARERNYDAMETAVASTEFITKVGGLAVDMGTASTAIAGAAAKAARFANILRLLYKDCKEMDRANAVMRTGVDLGAVFQACPLVGAYYVCCVPTSVLVNLIVQRWAQGGWRGEVEYNLVKHVEPLREQARRVIAEHRFVIKELQRFPGVLARNDEALAAMQAAYLMRQQAPPPPRQIFSGL